MATIPRQRVSIDTAHLTCNDCGHLCVAHRPDSGCTEPTCDCLSIEWEV